MASNAKVIFKFGTKAQYQALTTKLDNALYFLTDTGELYRGSVPFGRAHVYQGLRYNIETNAEAIARIVGQNAKLAFNDLLLLRNNDETVDIFMYIDTGWIKLNGANGGSSGGDNPSIPVSRIEAIETSVSGLSSQVSSLQSTTSSMAAELGRIRAAMDGMYHDAGTANNLNDILSPEKWGVYRVGTKEYVWTGSSWTELGDLIDVANMVTRVELGTAIADLEALIGNKAHDETDPTTGQVTHVPASGIYKEMFDHPDDIIPVFAGLIPGLVPVLTGNYTTEQKEQMFLNACGDWVQITNEGGVMYYVATDGQRFTSMTEFVTHMIDITPHKWVEFE